MLSIIELDPVKLSVITAAAKPSATQPNHTQARIVREEAEAELRAEDARAVPSQRQHAHVSAAQSLRRDPRDRKHFVVGALIISPMVKMVMAAQSFGMLSQKAFEPKPIPTKA